MPLKDKAALRDAIVSSLATDRGRVFFRNLGADLEARPKLSALIEYFLNELLADINAPSGHAGINECINSTITRTTSLKLTGPRLKATLGPLMSVLTFESIKKYYLDPTLAPVPKKLTNIEQARFLGMNNIPSLLAASARIGNGMLWMAPASDVDDYFKRRTKSADAVRSVLGLSHLVSDEVIVAFYFSNDIAKKVSIHRPTSFDAGANLIFRTDTSKTTFGHTVNLETLARGVREVVSEPLPSKEIQRAELVGQIDSMPEIHWGDIASSCVGREAAILQLLDP